MTRRDESRVCVQNLPEKARTTLTGFGRHDSARCTLFSTRGRGLSVGGGAGALQLQDLSCARQRLRQCPVPPGEACVQTRLDPRTPGWTQQMETGGFPVEPVTPLDGDYSSSGAWAVQDPEGGAESISPSSCSQR